MLRLLSESKVHRGIEDRALGGGFDFQGPASTASALGVLAAIITIHECGHFLAARLQNIHVTKFAIGFGPPLLKYQGPEVEYSLRAIPFGGYVGFPDDDPANPESKYPKDDPDLLSNRPIKDRALVISAGVIANIIFAFSILLTQVSTVGAVSSTFQAGVVVPEVIETSVAYKAGFKAGDVITQVAGRAVEASPYSVTKVVNKIKASPNERLTITVRRDGQLLDIPVTPAEAPDGGGRIGVQLAMNAKITRTVAKDPIQAAALASKEFTKLLNTVTNGLQQIVFNFAKTAEQVTGPVAIVAVGAEVARADVSGLFQFAAIVNINLAVVNLLPLPALDGGYLALLLVELARGKKLPQDVERGIMGSGLLLLMAVGIVLVVRDTVNLFPKSLL
ncbi:hypothetical protein WJX72_002001 [[Myrmecia] bisecta]|uniref:PDZ domain-containing protein n=1 Tax=[Myrmecia] bisecta TaxID=41462 RepID=A0AAW1PWN0_9CHLO